jgi:hypothetical protein
MGDLDDAGLDDLDMDMDGLGDDLDLGGEFEDI